MATISPVRSIVDGIPRVTWTGLTTGDTGSSFAVAEQWGLAAAVQISSSNFQSSTVALQVSNDGTNWFAIKDLSGTTVSATASAMFEITTSAAYIKPIISGGSTEDVNVILVLRGLY